MPGARRFEKPMAISSTTSDTPAIVEPGAVVVLQVDDCRQDEQRHQVHDLDERVERGAGGVLEGVADRVADDRRLVGLGALAAVVAVLDVLLGVVPRPARVRQVVGHQLAGDDHGGQERAEGEVVDPEADDHRREHGEQRRRGQLAERGGGADVDDGAVVGPLLAGHDLAVGELAADLLHHDTGGAATARSRARRT